MPVRSRLPVTVRTYEIDALNRIPPAVFLQWMQDAAMLASHENGYPPGRYRELGTAWVLGEILLEIDTHPHPTDDISVETWVADFGAARARRQYRVLDAEGRRLAAGEALWVYVNIESRRPQRFDDELLNAFVTDEQREPGEPDWGADLLKERRDAASELEHTVRWSELDGAFHVNNTVYATWLCDHLAINDAGPPKLSEKGTERIGQYGPGEVKRLRIRYRRGAELGETVTWRLTRPDLKSAVQEVIDATGKQISQAAVLLA